ncbi:MAG: PAS domain S-box protein [Dehalococcoidia bacterium]|nr:PAS domain S-box protein [Dehalococcoidia bacterium]MDD5493985.1 PAS domain S-box protein [Dehalococcoidia bacterium]
MKEQFTSKKRIKNARSKDIPILPDDSKLSTADPKIILPLFFKAVVNHSADLIYLVDADASILFVNEAVCKLLGYSREELHSMKLLDIDVLDDEGAWDKGFKNLRKQGSCKFETMHRASDGSVVPLEITANYLMQNGKEYCLGIGRDITERRKTERALKENEAKYRSLIDHAGAGVITINMGGYINFVNDTICQMLGYSRDELMDKQFADYIYKDDVGPIIEIFSEAVNGRRIKPTLEFRVIHKSGNIVWCYTKPTDLVYEDTAIGFSAIIHDITERKRLEEALKASEKRYKAVVEDQMELICRFLPDGTITFVNNAFCQFYDKSSDELIGRSYISLLSEPQYPAFTAAIEELVAFPGDVIYDIQPFNKGGETKWLERTMRALADENGQVKKFQVVLRDITDRRRAEQALRESEEQARLVFNSMLDGFVIFETVYDDSDDVTDARFLEVNPAFEKIVGLKANDVIGKTMWEVFPTMRLSTVDIWKKMLRERKAIHYEEYYLRTMDKYFRITGFCPKRGRYAIMFSDVTERKKVTERLISADRLSSLGEMAAGLAHEINNPLTGVIGLSQLIAERDDLPGVVREDVRNICREANRAAGIVKDFLTFARGHKPQKENADINALLESVIKLRSTHMKNSNIEVITDFAADLPALVVDISQIRQVFLNIILNAEYFMYEEHKKGKLNITTSNLNSTIHIVFKDDGPGIAPEAVTRIFDPFFTTKDIGRGTGLGLSISYGIIQEHGGHIYAESKYGHGASFIIELPVAVQ